MCWSRGRAATCCAQPKIINIINIIIIIIAIIIIIIIIMMLKRAIRFLRVSVECVAVFNELLAIRFALHCTALL